MTTGAIKTLTTGLARLASRGRKAILAASLFALSAAAGVSVAEPALTQASVLGTGPGLNHVSIVVHDLGAVQALFRDQLGFNVQFWGQFPEGLENAGIEFSDHTYIEFLAIENPAKAAATDEAAFLKEHEGAIGVGLEVDSAPRALDLLRQRDIPARIATTADDEYTGAGWKSVGTWLFREIDLPKEMPGGPFLIEYNRAARAARYKADPAAEQKRALERIQPNGAVRMSAVWIAVHDLRGSVEAYQRLGLRPGPSVDLPELSASGRAIVAGTGLLLLLTPKPGGGPVARFLHDRGDGLMGVTIEVADFAQAQAYLKAHASAIDSGWVGGKDHLLIPPPTTPGVWLRVEAAHGVR